MPLDGPQNDLLMRLLSASSLRAKTIAGNLSNVNTPGFTRKVVRFEEQLAAALGRADGDVSAALARVRPEVVADATSPAGADGNNVTMELEVNELRENQLLYELYASIFEARTRMLGQSIDGGH
jgi:flagellar basal-body rod protein FlgB